MSYEIIYDKNFIKVEQKNKETVYCPMVYTGSNNCYEYYNGRERRERSWVPFTYIANGKLLATKEEMLTKMEEEKQSLKDLNNEYRDKRFGYFTGLSIGGGCTATFGQYKGIVITGTKKSLTVEQCVENGIRISVRTGYDYKNEQLEEKGGPHSIYVETTEEFLQAIEELKEYVKGTTVNVTVNISASENIMKWIRKRLFPKTKKEKTLKTVDNYFTIYLPDIGGYYAKGTKSGYKYSYKPYKKYETKKEAQKTVNRLNKKRGESFAQVKQVDEKTQLYV